MEIKTFLVAICKKHTKEVVEWLDIPATDGISAVHLAFEIRPQYNSTTHYGEAIVP